MIKGAITSIALSCFAMSASAEDLEPNKTYEPNVVAAYIEGNGLQPYAQSDIKTFDFITQTNTDGGEMFALHSPDTGQWAIFQQTPSQNIKYLNGGGMHSDFSERHNSISVDYHVSLGVCENIAPNFSQDNDLLFAGASSDNDRIIMIFGRHAHNSGMQNNTSFRGTIVSQFPETGRCAILKSLSGLDFMPETVSTRRSQPNSELAETMLLPHQ